MGQYHRIYNIDKKESVKIGGAKLWEQTHEATAAALLLLLSNSNGRGGGDFNCYPQDYGKLTAQEKADQAIVAKASGRWSGDRIVVQGDYAEETDPSFITEKELGDYQNITQIVADALLIVDNGDNSAVVTMIESEMAMQFGSIKGSSSVEKVSAMDRNKCQVQKYQARGFSKAKNGPAPKSVKAGAK